MAYLLSSNSPRRSLTRKSCQRVNGVTTALKYNMEGYNIYIKKK